MPSLPPDRTTTGPVATGRTGGPAPERPPAEEREARLDLLAETASHGLRAVVRALGDGQISAEEGEQILVDLVAEAVDAALPTGPLDPLDDQVIHQLTAAGVGVVVQLLPRPSAQELRERAKRATRKGRDRRAARLARRAARLEALEKR